LRVVLAWRARDPDGPSLDALQVTSRLVELFTPLLDGPPARRVLEAGAMSVVFLEFPVSGWKRAYRQEDERTACVAADYPVDAEQLLRRRGRDLGGDSVLPLLCRELEHDAVPLLRALAPPFSLVWVSKERDEASCRSTASARHSSSSVRTIASGRSPTRSSH
jgi:hypothetical protein